MAININKFKGTLKAIGDRVLVSEMHFGEQKTAGGLIIGDDDGQTRGIYPRWGKVYSIGPRNKDDYKVGDWILIEHGRWTRGLDMDSEDGDLTLRMVEAESILAVSDSKPEDIRMGITYSDGPADIRPEDFGAN